MLGQFTVDQIEGEWTISSKKPLDREDTEKYLLKVMASDGKFQATTEVEIFVLDINDNSPECGQVRRLTCYIGGQKEKAERAHAERIWLVMFLTQSGCFDYT